MFAKLFAFLGSTRARKWDAQSTKARLADILEFLLGADTPLEEQDYAFVEKFFSASLQSEYRKELRKLRRKYTIIGCKMAMIECSNLMKASLTATELQWQADEERRTKRRPHPSLAFAETETKNGNGDNETTEPKFSDQITN